jgi:hypothetical protein
MAVDCALLFVFEEEPGDWRVALLAPGEDLYREHASTFSTQALALALAKELQQESPWTTLVVGCDPREPIPTNPNIFVAEADTKEE